MRRLGLDGALLFTAAMASSLASCGSARSIVDGAIDGRDGGDFADRGAPPPVDLGGPACTVSTEPDPAPGDAGAACSTFAITGAWTDTELFAQGPDGGIVLDGGAYEEPLGGALTPGDYDLVRYRATTADVTRARGTIQVFAGGRIHWAYDLDHATGTDHFRYNTEMRTLDRTLEVAVVYCGTLFTLRYGYTADVDRLSLYDMDDYGINAVFDYARTCTR